MSPVPAPLRGLWRREVITAPGFRDETTKVLWLQTASWYADIRVPADRPGARGAGFGGYSDAELVSLARIQGFAGELSATDDVCFWRRDLDHQPAGPIPDEARYTVDGDVMVEDGIHADYQEIWRREPGAGGGFAAFRREGGGGLMVLAGKHLLEFVARPGSAPEGPSLANLLEQALAAGDRAGAEALLATRIRYARAEGGGWWVELSSLPWLEGQPMWSGSALAFDPAAGRLHVEGPDGPERWTLIDASRPAEAIGPWLTGGAAP